MTGAPSASSRKRPGSMPTNKRNRMNKLILLLGVSLTLSAASPAQESPQEAPPVPSQEQPKVYPANWWIGMKYSTPELMIHGKDIGKAASVTFDYPGVHLVDWHRVTNDNYLFLHLKIAATAQPGPMTIHIQPKGGGRPIGIPYTLLARRSGNGIGSSRRVLPPKISFISSCPTAGATATLPTIAFRA
jgi:hypothetical protein